MRRDLRLAWAGTLEQILVEGDARAPNETGGMLLGYKTTAPDIDEFVIVDVVGPGPRGGIIAIASTRTVPGSRQRLEER
jgi:hypothetical protein